ncbi:MAG: hypothetical protein PHP07_03940 [Eubacteriales bacterium]|jgi:hypothetical protein|nr:hypothetical protein [Eubacteriales bacterium]MDD3572088.1 hypothetical protein [Eubacteriales bacterium]MDD4134800.1 hypothetical protein [Eubacteriales bacterium]NLO12824.1 hypothetical protein [Clostridiales bacterium]
MDLSGQRVLAYLQEDNTQRVLFRVRPLLSSQGLLAAEDIDAFRDQGFLRIAPDRQEQHTFKERMRELGPLCVLDLQGTAPAQGKVRPNRNYSPFRGEHNRYIVYSDAIKSLPRDMVYEVATREETRHAPLTPRYYVRNGGFINGPFSSPAEEAAGGTQTLPPDCDRLFLVLMPDNQHRMFYWPQEEQEALPQDMEEPTPKAREIPEPSSPVRSLTDMFFRRRQPLLMPQNSLSAAVSAVEDTMKQAGFIMGAGMATHLILLAALYPQFQVSSPALADAASAGETLAGLMGLNSLMMPGNDLTQQGGAERMTISPQAGASPLSRRHVIVSQAHEISALNTPVYALSPWPVVSLAAEEGWHWEEAAPTPINLDHVSQLLRQHQEPLSAATESRLKAWLRRLSDLGAPLPIKLRRDLLRYLRHSKALKMDEHTATGFAAAAFVLPYARHKGVPAESLRALLVDQPQALRLL